MSLLSKIPCNFLRFLSFQIDTLVEWNNHDYNSIMSRFNLHPLYISLYNRRTVEIIFLYKIVNNRIDWPALLIRGKLHVPGQTVGHSNLFYQLSYTWKYGHRTVHRRLHTIDRVCNTVNRFHSRFHLLSDPIDKIKRPMCFLLGCPKSVF